MKYAIAGCIAVILGSSCGPVFGGSCPEDIPHYEVEDGTYSGGELTNFHSLGKFEDSNDHELAIDRASNTATLTYTDSEGRAVVVSYDIVESR